MMVAYRRGLLTPYYKNGLSSILREETILSMLHMEMEATNTAEVMLAQNILTAPHVDGTKLSLQYGNVRPLLKYAAEKREYTPGRLMSAEELLIKESGGAIRDFQRMMKDGTIAAFDKQVEQMRKEEQAKQENFEEL